jgi:cell division ATPase FtsA
LPSGIVLTGGGSLLYQLNNLTTEITGIHTRIGKPKINAIYQGPLEHPSYATAYGLLVHASKEKNTLINQEAEGPLANRLFWKMRSWISDLF